MAHASLLEVSTPQSAYGTPQPEIASSSTLLTEGQHGRRHGRPIASASPPAPKIKQYGYGKLDNHVRLVSVAPMPFSASQQGQWYQTTGPSRPILVFRS